MKDNETNVVYSIQAYWQQGDDLAEHLEAYNDDVTKALHKWANEMIINGCIINDLVDEVTSYLRDNPDSDISIKPCCHSIDFSAPEELSEKLVEMHLLYKEEIENDEN